MPTLPRLKDPAWDRVKLGGKLLPGKATVAIGISCDLDVKKPDGGRGATIRDKGDDPIAVTIEWVLHEDEFEDAVGLASTLRPRSNRGARDPLEIEHPQCAFWGVSAVTIQDIDSPPPEPGGFWTITIKCIEWFPAPKPANKSAKTPQDSPEDVAAWREYADEEATGPNAPDNAFEDPADALGISLPVPFVAP